MHQVYALFEGKKTHFYGPKSRVYVVRACET